MVEHQMVSMLFEPEKREETVKPTLLEQGPFYPHGLRINLCHRCLERLGIEELPPVGTELLLKANVEVVSTAIDEEKKKDMCLQITSMGIYPKEGEEKREGKEEGKDGGKEGKKEKEVVFYGNTG